MGFIVYSHPPPVGRLALPPPRPSPFGVSLPVPPPSHGVCLLSVPLPSPLARSVAVACQTLFIDLLTLLLPAQVLSPLTPRHRHGHVCSLRTRPPTLEGDEGQEKRGEGDTGCRQTRVIICNPPVQPGETQLNLTTTTVFGSCDPSTAFGSCDPSPALGRVTPAPRLGQVTPAPRLGHVTHTPLLLHLGSRLHILKVQPAPVPDVPSAALLAIDVRNRTGAPRVVQKVPDGPVSVPLGKEPESPSDGLTNTFICTKKLYAGQPNAGKMCKRLVELIYSPVLKTIEWLVKFEHSLAIWPVECYFYFAP